MHVDFSFKGNLKIMKKRKNLKRGIWILLVFLFVGNFVIYNHAYKFTHFVESDLEKTKRPEELNLGEKLKTLFFGIAIPKPVNKKNPTKEFQTIELKSIENLEAWYIPVTQPKGIVLMFHGYSSSKSGILAYSNEFNNKGFSTFLVDFMGSGGSSGNQTTVGFKESKDVKVAYDFVKTTHPESEIILFGCSMGAAAILKSIEEFEIKPDKVIIECPFGSMLKTTKKRFEAMNLPTFLFPELLLFYGGIQNGFNAFNHKPSEYAKNNKIPTLLLYGAKDARVTYAEIDEIYQNLAGEKRLVIFENSGHEVYLNDDRALWNEAINGFLLN